MNTIKLNLFVRYIYHTPWEFSHFFQAISPEGSASHPDRGLLATRLHQEFLLAKSLEMPVTTKKNVDPSRNEDLMRFNEI